MKKLIDALEIRKQYNNMTFDEFADEYEKWSSKKVSKEERKQWKFTGLNNVDFITNVGITVLRVIKKRIKNN